MDRTALLGVLLMTALVAPLASGSVLPPPLDDPVVNGEFELFMPSQVPSLLEGSPADECIGIGHQVLYGSDTFQKRLEKAADNAADNDTDGAAENASAAAQKWVDDPIHEGTFLSGYGHCVFSSGEGYDLVWLNPVTSLQRPAVHWSQQDGNTQFGDFTGSGDREARIRADPSASGHNMWQAYPSPFQAYTGNFDALEFRVEGDTFDDMTSGSVKISLSATPLEAQTPYVLIWIDCTLGFDLGVLRDNASPIPGTDDYQVSVDPTTASSFAPYRNSPDCQDATADWNAGDEQARQELLGRLRIVQLSFWNFNRGTGDVLIDGASLSGASTAAEEAASGNINL